MKFGFFAIQYSEEKKDVFREFLECDYVNVFLVGDKENGCSENSRKSFEMIHAAGKKCYVYFYDMTFERIDGQGIVDVGEAYDDGPRTVLKKDWRENLAEFRRCVENAPIPRIIIR